MYPVYDVNARRRMEIPQKMTELISTMPMSSFSESRIATMKNVLADGRWTQRGGGLHFVDLILRGTE